MGLGCTPRAQERRALGRGRRELHAGVRRPVGVQRGAELQLQLRRQPQPRRTEGLGLRESFWLRLAQETM